MRSFSILMAAILLPLAAAWSGTSVGNFSYHTQRRFDFRLGHMPTWKFTAAHGNPNTNEIENWRIENGVSDPAHRSSANLAFLEPFPAANDQELLSEITKLHPGLQWQPLRNPDFAIGYVSNQVAVGPARTRSFEYYFSEKRKIVRIETLRDSEANGASEVDAILATIRRPSAIPKITSISYVGDVAKEVKVGEQACYKIEIDILRSDFTIEILSRFEYRGAWPHWSFKSIRWSPSDSSLFVCTTVHRKFEAAGLVISSLALGAAGGSIQCADSPVAPPGGAKLTCTLQDGSVAYDISYQVPRVDNPAPLTQAPQFIDFRAGAKNNSIKVSVSSAGRLKIGQITIDQKTSEDDDSQIIYEDDLKSTSFEVEFEAKRLRNGFTRVLSMMLTDEVGNVGMLKALPGSQFYTYYSTGAKPAPTQIPVISLMGVRK